MYILASKFRFFRVSFTIEPGRSLLQFVTTNCLISTGIKPLIFLLNQSIGSWNFVSAHTIWALGSSCRVTSVIWALSSCYVLKQAKNWKRLESYKSYVSQNRSILKESANLIIPIALLDLFMIIFGSWSLNLSPILFICFLSFIFLNWKLKCVGWPNGRMYI